MTYSPATYHIPEAGIRTNRSKLYRRVILRDIKNSARGNMTFSKDAHFAMIVAILLLFAAFAPVFGSFLGFFAG